MVASVGEEAVEPLAEMLHRCAEYLTAGLEAEQKGPNGGVLMIGNGPHLDKRH